MTTLSSAAEDAPSFLWHYTTIETLALILQHQTLRLMPLTGVDDPTENQTRDVPNLGRFFFVSCWTDQRDESIPMWNMYATLGSGVRIGLPAVPFVTYPAIAEDWHRATGIRLERIDIEEGSRTFLPVDDVTRGLCSPLFMTGEGILKPVQYTRDEDRLFPRIIETSPDGLALNMRDFGRCKSPDWAFQHEWRYMLPIVPFNMLENPASSHQHFNEMVLKMASGVLAAPCPYYDLRLDPEALKGIEITPSPRLSAGNRVLLDALLAAHGLTANLRDSQLVGRL